MTTQRNTDKPHSKPEDQWNMYNRNPKFKATAKRCSPNLMKDGFQSLSSPVCIEASAVPLPPDSDDEIYFPVPEQTTKESQHKQKVSMKLHEEQDVVRQAAWNSTDLLMLALVLHFVLQMNFSVPSGTC